MTLPPTIHRIDDVVCKSAEPQRFTAILPAAGEGTRLGAKIPKALVEIAGRPVLLWIWDALQAWCGELVIVVAPHTADRFGAFIDEHGLPARLAVQTQPLGMADAVFAARELITTEHVIVAWGDHASLRPATVEACASEHLRRGAHLTLPTVVRDEPYIEFHRDASGRLLEVRERREGQACGDRGESDCGVFVFTSAMLFAELERARIEGAGIGAVTGDQNLLPLLPQFDTGAPSVISVRLTDLDQTVGLNTTTDLDRLAEILGER